jgi:cytidylate kinase
LLDQLVRDPEAQRELLADLPAGVGEWAEARLAVLQVQRKLAPSSLAAETARMLFTLAARGEAVVIGRGAGFILPPESTLHVRIIAPKAERIRYLSDWMRLSPAEGEAEVNRRDDARDTFLKQLHDGDPHDPLLYDLTLNSSRLGVEACTAIIVHAVNDRHHPDDGEEFPEWA